MKIKRFVKKSFVFIGVAGLAVAAVSFQPSSVEAATITNLQSYNASTATNSSVFANNVQDGQILQCFCWSYKEIMEYLPKIAEQGFTALQTSPVQVCKEQTVDDGRGNARIAKDTWWAYYQPAAFTVDDTGDNALGTPEEFKQMCDMAHEYGVKVLVDVVANHLGNQWVADSLCERAYYYEWEIAGMSSSPENGGYIPYTGKVWNYNGGTSNPGDPGASNVPVIDTYYYRNTMKFHPYQVQDNDQAGNVTQGNIGMMDLDTSSSIVQNRVAEYLEELVDYGVDGFRFDAAKHIETPFDQISSNFWPFVMNRARNAAAKEGREIYAYGEILNRQGIGRKLNWYTDQGIAITDSGLGHNTVESNGSGISNFNYADDEYYGNYSNHLVTWAESHDNYMGTQDTHNKPVSVINKSYAILGARKNFATLYCARFEDYNKSTLGNVAALNGWSYSEIGAVNKFHNYFSKNYAEEDCYMRNGYTVVERYGNNGDNGIVVVGNSGDFGINVNHLANGTYIDHVSGRTFTVNNGYLSGCIDGSGIAVIYNASFVQNPSISTSKASGNIKTDTLEVNLTFRNTTSSKVLVDGNTINSSATGAYVNVKNIQIGQTVTVNVEAYGENNTKATQVYTYKRVESTPSVKLYFENTNNWSTVNAYCWNEEAGTKNASWPGQKLSQTVKNKAGNTCYVIDFDLDEYDHVIFNNGSEQTVDIEVNDSVMYTLGNMGSKAYSVTQSEFVEYIDTPTPTNEITVSFQNTNNWSNVYVYVWKGTTPKNVWPGELLTKVATDNQGKNVYQTTVDLNKYDHIIFNDGNGNQTKDLELKSTTTGFTANGSAYSYEYVEPVEKLVTVYFQNTNNWSKVNAYVWGTKNDISWPGVSTTYVGLDSQGYQVYSYTVNILDYQNIIFTNGSGSQTKDLIITENTTGYKTNGNTYIYTK